MIALKTIRCTTDQLPARMADFNKNRLAYAPRIGMALIVGCLLGAMIADQFVHPSSNIPAYLLCTSLLAFFAYPFLHLGYPPALRLAATRLVSAVAPLFAPGKPAELLMDYRRFHRKEDMIEQIDNDYNLCEKEIIKLSAPLQQGLEVDLRVVRRMKMPQYYSVGTPGTSSNRTRCAGPTEHAAGFRLRISSSDPSRLEKLQERFENVCESRNLSMAELSRQGDSVKLSWFDQEYSRRQALYHAANEIPGPWLGVLTELFQEIGKEIEA